jgi:hypothetical protein
MPHKLGWIWLDREVNGAAHAEMPQFGLSGPVEPIEVWGWGPHLCSSSEDGERANLSPWCLRSCKGHGTQPVGGFV